MQITSIKIKNFLSITDVEIKPGQINQIVGANNQGKTTILRAIETALKGSTDGSLVKHGTEGAEIIIDFDNDLSINRRISAQGGQSVKVMKGEFLAPKPQTMLDEIFSGVAFNPLDLLDVKKRTEALLKAIDLKITPQDIVDALDGMPPMPMPEFNFNDHGLKVIDAIHKYFYDRRSEANQVTKKMLGRAEALKAEAPETLEKIDESISIEGLKDSLRDLQTQILAEDGKGSAQKLIESKIRSAGDDIKGMDLFIAENQGKINALEAQLEIKKQNRYSKLQEIEKLQEESQNTRPDASVVDKLKTQYQAINSEILRRAELEVDKHKQRAARSAHQDYVEAKHVSDALDKAVNAMGNKFKARMISKIDLPIDKLSYEEGEFKLEGASIDNLSSSKQLKLAIALSRKLASETKLICIDGAELLDEDSWNTLMTEIKDDGFVYFITKVGEAFGGSDKVLKMKQGNLDLQN